MFGTERHGSTVVELSLDEASPDTLLRVNRLARELRLTDQILSVDLDTVHVCSSGPAPAWTSLEGDRVSFAFNQMPKPQTALDVAVWLGTNAHELGHVLFSPRRSSTLMYRVLESERAYLKGVAMLHNIVEDQRQERLLLARFTPWTGYLTAALGHHLRADSDTSWLLFAGRTWLPQGVRDTAKALMVAGYGHSVTDAVTRIVGEYQRLVDPGDTEADEAWELLNELHTLFADQMPNIPTGCTVMDGGEPDIGEPGDGDNVPDTADEAESPSDDDDAEGDGAGDDSDGSDDDSDDGDDGSATTDQGTKSSDGGAGGSGASDQPAPQRPPTRDEVRKALRDHAAAQIDSNEDTRDDLSSVLDALDHTSGAGDAQGADPVGRFIEATDTAHRLHRDVSDALLDLKDESEPGWLKRVDSGRLKVSRLLDPNADADELFDRYEPGMMDSSELEVVLLLDVSGSMAGSLTPLAEATWAIRMAVDDLEGRCTVFTWDTGPHRVLADANDRPDGRMFRPQSMGGTDPTSALTEAFRLLAGSDATNRLMVIMTDGDWFTAERKSEQVIAAMNEQGMTTVIALLGSEAGDDIHGCQFGAVINDPHELSRLFRRVATEQIASWR